MSTIHGSRRCDYCEDVCPSRASFRRHLQSSHGLDLVRRWEAKRPFDSVERVPREALLGKLKHAREKRRLREVRRRLRRCGRKETGNLQSSDAMRVTFSTLEGNSETELGNVDCQSIDPPVVYTAPVLSDSPLMETWDQYSDMFDNSELSFLTPLVELQYSFPMSEGQQMGVTGENPTLSLLS